MNNYKYYIYFFKPIFSIVKINIIIFIFILLFKKGKLSNYISFEFHMIDDCIREINISNDIIFGYTPENLSMCDFAYQNIYPKFFIKNYKYELGINVIFIFQDSCHFEGFMNITVYFNEYIIKVTDKDVNKFWKCIDCDTEDKNYYYNDNRLNFYMGRHNGEQLEKNYTFIFSVDSLSDLYNSDLGINNDYYELNTEKEIYLELYYLNNELELINFNNTKNFHIKENSTFPIDYSNYFFKIEYNNEFSGTLKGINLLDQKIDLTEGDSFKVSDEMGLWYKLSEEDKENKKVNISLKITAYDCPKPNNYKCISKRVSKETYYYFIITLYGYSDTLQLILSDTLNSPQPILSSTDILQNYYFDLGKCISQNIENSFNTLLCPNYSIEKMNENINEIVNQINENTNYKIKTNDYIIQITLLENNSSQNLNKNIFSLNLTYVNFSECEKILRDYYKIFPPRKIIFIQIEINNINNNILINQIEYQAYDDNKNILNLSLCNSTNIKIYYSLKNNEEDIINLISSFKEKNINILNLNDSFYNDVCIPYSNSKNDLTLNDRIEEFYKNYSFCENNCKLEEIILENMIVVCDCSVKTKVNMKDLNFDVVRYEIKKNTNFEILKCFNSFQSFKNNLFNLGFWIFLFLMILNIIFLILFCCLGIKAIKKYMNKEMAKYGYIEKSDEGHAFCHNYIKKLDKLLERLKQSKNNYLKKKDNFPPKHKVKQTNKKNNSTERSVRKEFLNKITKDNNNLEKKLKNLKERMEKTKRFKYKNVDRIKVYKNIKDKDESNKNEKRYQNETNNNESEEDENNFKINIININVNDLQKKIHIPQKSPHVLNIYNFEEAKKYDKRNLCLIYYIFLIAKQVIMHAFLYKSPLEPLSLRLSVLKFIFGCDMALNAIFYTDSKISEKYHSKKNMIVFALTNNILIILLSILIGYVLMIFISNLNNSINEIRKVFRDEEEKIKKNKKYIVTLERKKEIILEVKRIINKLKIKIIIFYIIEFLFMIFFWYYVTIFCYIYNKTQLSWIVDTLITILIKIIIDLFINLLLSILYKISILANSRCLYAIIIFLYCFI